jgi:hypothetical protein
MHDQPTGGSVDSDPFQEVETIVSEIQTYWRNRINATCADHSGSLLTGEKVSPNTYQLINKDGARRAADAFRDYGFTQPFPRMNNRLFYETLNRCRQLAAAADIPFDQIDRAMKEAEALYHYELRVMAPDINLQLLGATRHSATIPINSFVTNGYVRCLRLFERLRTFSIHVQARGLIHKETAHSDLRKELTSSIAGARESEGSKPPNRTQQGVGDDPRPTTDPFIPLTSWNDILVALNEPHGKPVLKNNEQTRDKIRKLNNEHDGPIKFPPGKGKQPSVGKDSLMVWWTSLRDHFDARTDEANAEAESARLTVADSHEYGAFGKVVPGIGGSEKRPRKETKEKGKEGKR